MELSREGKDEGGTCKRDEMTLRRKDGDVGSRVWHETCWGGGKKRVVFTLETLGTETLNKES